MVLVSGPERHHEAGRAEAALRAVAIDHRLLHRVQFVTLHRVEARAGVQIFDREQGLAVERRQELDAGIGRGQAQPADDFRRARLRRPRQLADDDGAGTAIAFVAAFLGADAARVFAQPVEHRARGRRAADFDDGAAVEEADRAARHGSHGLG